MLLLVFSTSARSPDVNSDNCIDVQDLTIIGLNRGRTSPLQADVNEDGIIDNKDYSIVENLWLSASYSKQDVCQGFSCSKEEVCNGLDDDCNGLIDDNLRQPQNTNQNGVCSGSLQICGGAKGWMDDYSSIPNYEVDEVSCDKLDNDCDKEVDETCGLYGYLSVATLKDKYQIGERVELTDHPASKIQNTGTTDIKGYLLMKVQKKVNEEWQDVKIIANDEKQARTIKAGEFLALDIIWNNAGAYTTTDAGTFRVYAALTDEEGKVIETTDGKKLEDVYVFMIGGLFDGLPDVCSAEKESKEELEEESPEKGKTDSFAFFVDPQQSESSNKLSLFFDEKLGVNTKELTQQVSNVIDYDKNSITLEFDGKKANPFILTKSGQDNVKLTSFDGYIIELKQEPILEKKEATEEEIKKIKEEVSSIDTSGLKFFFNGPIKFIKKVRIKNLEKNFEKNLNKYEIKIEKEHSKVKEDIQKILSKSRANNSITGFVVKSQEEAEFGHEFKNAFNGIALKDISEEEAHEIEKLKSVEKVSPNFEVKISLKDSVSIIKADKLWDLGYTGNGIEIAIIDTGVDYMHADLGGCLGSNCKVIGGYDFVNNDADPMDDMGHGTHVAATAAGNGVLKGVAPEANIVAYKVLDSFGSGSFANVIAAIERSVDPNQDGNYSDHLDVISLSLGGPGNPDDPPSKAIDNAVDAGVIAVVAAGNSGPSSNTIGSPGTARKSITVGATNKNNIIAEFSSRGPVIWENGTIIKPDIVAPGVNICAAQWDDAWSYAQCLDDEHVAISGTSMATPHVSGAAALLLQANPSWEPEDVKSALMLSAHDLDIDINAQGAGLANVEKANEVGILVYPSSITFGIVIDKLPDAQKIIIKNNKNESVKLYLKADCGVAKLSKEEITINPKSSEEILFSLIDIPQREGTITGNIYIFDGENIYDVPYMFKVASELKVIVESGKQPSYSDIAITNDKLSFVDYKFEAINSHTFYVHSGKYTVYAGGNVVDLDSTEYLLMKSVDVPRNKKITVTLHIRDAKPFNVKAESLDGTKLVLYEWQKAFRAYNDKGCFINYDLTDPNYGDRTVYVSNKPEGKFDVDVFFKYDGVPSKIEPETKGSGSSRSFSWRTCD